MIGVGIAGCGAIATRRHIPEYEMNPNARIVGLFDVVAERSAALAEQHGVKAYCSYEEMLRDPGIQAVSICTANRFHAEMAIQALNAGKHVLCEKPIATTLADAEEMIKTAERCGRNLMIAHNQRLNPIHIRAKEILRDGWIGRPLTFRSFFMHKGPETWSVDRGNGTWFFDKSKAFLGAMCDLGLHKIDLLRWLLDDEFSEATAMLGTLDKKDLEGRPISLDDNGMCILRTRKGIMGMVGAGWTCYCGEENGTTIFGTEGVLRLNEDASYAIIVDRTDGERICIEIGQIQTNDHQTASGVIDQFIDELEHGVPPEIDGWEGLKALQVIHACAESSATGQKVLLRDFLP